MKTIVKDERKPASEMIAGIADNLSINQIGFSPLNYRKFFRQADLEAFAEELKLHGIISPLTVRKLSNEKYELVAGERRLRAAMIANLQTVPVIIRDLTDEQVTEIQLAENLQRENPHPLEEANAVKLMLDTGKNIDEISLRLGKSKQFVYVRLKLLNLVDPIREMFFGEVINLQEALTIATISQQGQMTFFEEHCTRWKQKNFQLHNLEWNLRPYKYDLKDAPFDTKDKKLIPEIGACTGCPFNSATLKTLFPDYAKQAVCTNISCYGNKCDASLRAGLITGLQEHQPVALLFDGEPSEKMADILKQIPETERLTRHDYNHITLLPIPEEPQEEDFMYEDDDDNEKLDRKALNTAVQEYKEELKQYVKHTRSGKYQIGLQERNGNFAAVWFNLDTPRRNDYLGNGKTTSMKEVQEAIKEGTASVDLLESAIDGIKHREVRAKELDREKIQIMVLTQVEEKACELATIKGLTESDKVAARLLVYQSLDHNSRQTVNTTLFKKVKEVNFETLKKLTDKEYSYMIRMALAGKSDSKYPNNITGIILYKVAEAAGVDVKKIEAEQQGKAETRAARTKERLKDLNKRKTKLKSPAK